MPAIRSFQGATGLLLLLAVLALLPARAQGSLLEGSARALSQYKVDVWQTEQGLPLNTVQALYQSHDGYLWVGTAGGLARFDGARFTGFDARQAPSMASEPVFGFMEDGQKNLWIGHSKGAAIYRKGSFQTMFGSELTDGRRVWAFAQAADGAVWAATENGLVRWNKGATRLYQQADGLPSNRLRTLAFDRAGTLWIGTSGGGLVALADGRFRTLGPEQGFPHLQVRHVIADPAGGIWAATAGAGLVRVQEDGRMRVYTVADGLPSDQLTSLARDAQGALWIGSWGAGLSRMSEDGRFSTISTANGLAGDQIWSVQADREGSIWIGTWVGGLNRLRNRAFGVLGTPEGLSHDNVRAVLHGRQGVSWVATSGGGLNRIEENGQRISVLRKADGLPTDEISSLLEDRDGALWIGSYTAGVARLQGGKIERFGPDQGLPSAEVRALFQDRSGTLWAGTQSGLARFSGKGFEAVRDAGAPRGGVAAMLQDRQGTLWFGTTGDGLVRLRDGRFETLSKADGLVSNWIMALYEDADAKLWIGTNGEGMNRLSDGRLTAIRPADGLWDGIALTILEDRAGYLWMSCNRGFFRVARAELNAFAEGRVARVKSTGYGPGDALRSTTFAGGLQPAGAIDAQGRLWLPSSNGLVIVDPVRLPGAGQPPQIQLEGVLLDGVNRPLDAEVLLPPGSVPLTIRYTAMTLLNADRVRFRYQMEGITRDWVDAGRSREAAFPALPHGRYRFRVAASTDGEHWSEAAAPLLITVRPYLYQTAWFQALALLGTLAAMLALFRLRTHALRARQVEMERLVAQRTEELRLANEHLSRLSFVDALTGLANRRRFDEVLAEEWRRARRNRVPLALVIADIDGFKLYNDRLGHLEGDRCLSAVAAVFAHVVGRAGDLAARYGGEEFVVLLPGADPAAAARVAEGIRAACEALAIPHPAAPVGEVITLSLGVASCLPSEQTSAETLFALADAALYRAKQEGRNRVCVGGGQDLTPT
ncbi:two-component regulator propeller domain-containing protein [Paucibacter soli]|uniref:two-component regulator propeller domain-containing protein n=1 Tax=Paucibacter soli TaxID=3133433 RepID=UPI00309667FB